MSNIINIIIMSNIINIINYNFSLILTTFYLAHKNFAILINNNSVTN